MDREDLHDFITRTRALMIHQLQEDVIEHLYDERHLNEEEYNQILSYESRENKIICLLDILPSKSGKVYRLFMEHIEHWYQWIRIAYTEDMLNRNNNAALIERILDEAEVPSLPMQHVSRKDELIKLNDYLHSMKRGEYVVVHGMGGCGKSTLVIEALRRSPTLVLDAFKQKIFWLMVGRESAVKKEALNEAKVKELTIQQELYTKLFTYGGYSSPPLPLDNEEGKRKLKEKLSESDFEDCLLILDDVPSSNFVECLNIGCKILVTTDNKEIMDSIKNQNRIQFLEVSQGFTEFESLQLFSKNLESTAKLPNQAKHIHALCKGFPLTISLIASQLAEFREDVLRNRDRWDAYVEHLKNKDIEAAIGRCDRYRQEQIFSLHKALKMSIDSLSSQLQKYYQDFALFMDDVNIKPEVLTTLWKVEKKEVEDIMSEFEKKCLVIRTWNCQLLSYVYCVHDLLLDYLKRRLTGVELQNLHKKLISRYCEKFGHDFVNFPRNDNYIFLYLGYHLKEGGHDDKFPELYFNLKFIEVKILIHGAADVLYDFKKYKDYITTTAENTKKYEELYNFISRIGICRVLSSTDIVQFALAECQESYVYKMGIEEAKNSEMKYFEYLTEVPRDCSSPDVHPLRGEKITAAVFTADGNVILANTDNLIKVIRLNTHETIVTFEGHDEKITRLHLSTLKVFFLSASEGCTVKIWHLNSYGGEGGYLDKPRTPSPSLAQKAWKDSWPQQRVSAEKPTETLTGHSLPIIDAQFSPKGLSVVTASEDKTIIVWRFAIEQRQSDFKLIQIGSTKIPIGYRIISCCFSADEAYIVGATTNYVMVYTVVGDCHWCFSVGFMINSVAVVPSALSSIQVLVLGENYKSLWDVSRERKEAAMLTKSVQYSTLSRRRQDECICAAVSNDGRYLALAPTFYCIIVKEIKTDLEVAKFHETNGKISGITWACDNKSILTTYESALFKVWNLPKETDDRVVKLKASVFDAAWIADQDDHDDQDNDELLVTAVLDTEYNINIFHDLQLHKKISTQVPDSGDICQLCVCPTNGHIIYACKDGTVGLIVFEESKSYFVDKISCNKVLKLKVFSDGAITSVLLLVEKSPNKFDLLGWINDLSSGDSNHLGRKIIYVHEGECVLDFSADLKQKYAVYVTKTDHTFDVYDLRSGTDVKVISDGDIESDDEDTDSVESTDVKFVDFSPSFRFMATGNDFGVLLTELDDNKKCLLRYENAKATVCKFNFDEKYIAVGFASGLVRVYDTENKNEVEFGNTSSVFDLMWSKQDNQLLVILDREIALYNVTVEGCCLISITYLSVDKVLINNSFSQFVTVDNGGHFQVLKHQL